MSNTVTLDISTYNTLKADAVRANMIVDHLFRTAQCSDGKTFHWDDHKLAEVLEVTYPKRFANKIAEFDEHSELEDIDT